MDELHGPGPVGELDVEVIGQARPLQLQLRGLQAGLRTCLCMGKHGDGRHVKGTLVYPTRCDVEQFESYTRVTSHVGGVTCFMVEDALKFKIFGHS